MDYAGFCWVIGVCPSGETFSCLSGVDWDLALYYERRLLTVDGVQRGDATAVDDGTYTQYMLSKRMNLGLKAL